MNFRRALATSATLALLATSLVIAPAVASSHGGTNFRASLSRQTTLRGIDSEIRPEADADTDVRLPGRRIGNTRHLSADAPKLTGDGPSAVGAAAAAAGSTLGTSFEGLNHFDTRFGVDGGNAFSTEPPDQGLCVGNGYVFESVNNVIGVYSTSGNLLAEKSLNTFYGYPFALNRTTGIVGPVVFDPTCYYDAPTHRWYQVAITLAVDSAGNYTGKSTIDVAVSTTSSPIGTWNIYRVPAQNDGTDGTPNHNCAGGPCFPDYPHIGADANGFYVTINEYSFFDTPYYGVDVYAFSKAQLAAGNQSATANLTFADGNGPSGAFTMWPAQSPGNGQYASGQGGTEYFLSTDEAVFDSGSANHVLLWGLTNTSSLDATPSLHLQSASIEVSQFGIPAEATQKAGDTPLRDCVNDTKLNVKGQGSGCWRFFFDPNAQPAHDEVLGGIDPNDTRMQQVSYASGQVWGALDTDVSGNRAGIAWFAVTPSFTRGGSLGGTLAAQGLVAATGTNSVVYPAIGMTASGKGVMAFTLVGPDYFPSAAYVTLSLSGTSAIQIARAGQDSEDGFSEYRAFGPPFQPRWGDYGAAAVDGNAVWIASEYIEARCTYDEWLASNFRCGDTRTSLGNWSTRISKVTP